MYTSHDNKNITYLLTYLLTCNIGVYPIHVLHVYEYKCNTCATNACVICLFHNTLMSYGNCVLSM